MTRFFIVPVFVLAALVVTVLAGVLVLVEFSHHQEQYPNESETSQLMLALIAVYHRIHVLFVAAVIALSGAALWVIAVLLALERL